MRPSTRGEGRRLGLHARWSLRGCDAVGPDALVVGSPRIENLGTIRIGRGLEIYASPIVSHLATGAKGVLEIGSEVVIAHGVGITAYANIEIGDRTRIGPFTMIMDTDFHQVTDHFQRPVPKPIRIGAGVRVGARCTILRGSSIGDGVTIDAGSVVAGEVPAHAHIRGVPARPVSSSGRPG